MVQTNETSFFFIRVKLQLNTRGSTYCHIKRLYAVQWSLFILFYFGKGRRYTKKKKWREGKIWIIFFRKKKSHIWSI
jgi:hypothetical protein